MEIKIGMVAPRKAGKTSLLATTFSEMRTRLSGNADGIQYWAADDRTHDAITNMMAEYRAIMATKDNIFETPQMVGTAETYDYHFSYSIPVKEGGTQRLNIWFKDFPGGLVGRTEFEDEVGPFVGESTALLVPIPSDILMELARTDGKKDPRDMRKNIAAACSLRLNDTIAIIKNWIDRKASAQSESLLVFVPVRCEAYFNDNGGSDDKSDLLFGAVQKFYVEPLALTADHRKSVQVEIRAVDTYGTVELKSVDLVKTPNGGEELESTFKKRLSAGLDIRSKGAFDILAAISGFELQKSAKALSMQVAELRQQLENRSIWTRIWDMFFGSDLEREHIKKMTANKAAYEAIAAISKLVKPDDYRRKVLNKIMD